MLHLARFHSLKIIDVTRHPVYTHAPRPLRCRAACRACLRTIGPPVERCTALALLSLEGPSGAPSGGKSREEHSVESAWERSAMASSTFPALILTTSSSWARGSDFIIISQTLNQVHSVRRRFRATRRSFCHVRNHRLQYSDCTSSAPRLHGFSG